MDNFLPSFSINNVIYKYEDFQVSIFLGVTVTHFCGALCHGIMQCFLPCKKKGNHETLGDLKGGLLQCIITIFFF